MKPNIILRKNNKSRIKRIEPFKYVERTRVSGNKILGKGINHLLNLFKFNDVIIYDPKVKSIINYTRGIGNKNSKDYIPSSIEVFQDLFKMFKEKKNDSKLRSTRYLIRTKDGLFYKDPKNRFTVQEILRKSNSNSNNTLISFKLSINLPNNKKKNYFVKLAEGDNYQKIATNEMILQKYLEKIGFNVIKPRFAFSSIEGKSNFIVYDYISNLKNIGENLHLIPIKISNFILEKMYSFNLKFSNKNINDIIHRNAYYKVLPSGDYKIYFSDLFINNYIVDELKEFAQKKRLIK
jgi:hypothetical protein